MKRLFVLVCVLLLLSGCGQKAADIPVASPVEKTEASNPADVPMYSQEQAMIEGFLVMQLGDVRYNQQNWFAFLEKAQAGESAEINVIHFYDNGSGWGQILYELSYDGTTYSVSYQKDGAQVKDSASPLTEQTGYLEDADEPYDWYHRYCLNDLVLYEDKVIVPDFKSDIPISLHAKEGDPALRDYTDPEEISQIVSLLSGAEYLPCEPEDYLYGMKLLTADADGEGIVVELDLRYGNYRYGTQVFHYGVMEDLFEVLNIDCWPDSVLREFGMKWD